MIYYYRPVVLIDIDVASKNNPLIGLEGGFLGQPALLINQPPRSV